VPIREIRVQIPSPYGFRVLSPFVLSFPAFLGNLETGGLGCGHLIRHCHSTLSPLELPWGLGFGAWGFPRAGQAPFSQKMSTPVHSCHFLSTPVTFDLAAAQLPKNPCYNAHMKRARFWRDENRNFPEIPKLRLSTLDPRHLIGASLVLGVWGLGSISVSAPSRLCGKVSFSKSVQNQTKTRPLSRM
jgi:hypothetical protein